MSQYKDTLNLPKTEFPMKAGLTEKEPVLLERWNQDRLYHRIQEARSDAPAYILHDGPPFANGDIHMGTALNKILKDLVVRSKTMSGFRTPFVPGWDCHGLPIEFKVVKESSGLSPVEVRKRSEAYARKFIDIQRRQFRRLGCLGDWENPYLTLDPGYESEIIRSFGRFVEKGLVYRSKKPVLWSTGAQTALAEAEVEYKEKTSPSIYVRFPLVEGPLAGQADIIIWTTTPWTLPANLAIAVHPTHSYVAVRLGGSAVVLAEALVDNLVTVSGLTKGEVLWKGTGAELVGSKARHPFLNRQSTVYPADFVTLDAGTGCVHVAPGHGEDDYHLGVREKLDLLSPVDDNGRYTAECGRPEWVGTYVFDANPVVIETLRASGALVAHQEYQHSYPHCWRSKTPVIFRAVEQFFIRIDQLRNKALEEIDRVDWIPHWGKNRIRGTVESRPDWCISRQRTWGVPLPVFYQPDGQPILDPQVIDQVADLVREHGTNAWFEWSDADWNARLGLAEGTTRRNDTLDVWIDSGVSHQAVLRNRPELHFPADLYLEATDQHRGWFQSSLMTSVALNESSPYRTCLTHGFVVDVDTRQKISKSNQGQGGYQKPTEAEHFVNKYGADLVRLWASSVNFTDDVPFSEEIFTRLSDAYRRIRNTLRILLANSNGCTGTQPAELPLVDRWILAKLAELIQQCREAYERLEFHRVYHAINQFCAVELSSLYVDITKDRLYCDARDSRRRLATQWTMRTIFEALTKLIAPILVYTAEEAWGYFKPERSIHLETFPAVDEIPADASALALGDQLLALRGRITQAVEVAQKAGEIGKPLECRVRVGISDPELRHFVQSHLEEVEEFLILSHLEVESGEDTVQVEKTPHARCERCWRHRADVGTHEGHPTLCGRCAAAVTGILA